jgi:hypothetical protein
MKGNHAIKKALERSGYSDRAIRAILAWYLPKDED